jgi:hypothetical protein
MSVCVNIIPHQLLTEAKDWHDSSPNELEDHRKSKEAMKNARNGGTVDESLRGVTLGCEKVIYSQDNAAQNDRVGGHDPLHGPARARVEEAKHEAQVVHDVDDAGHAGNAKYHEQDCLSVSGHACAARQYVRKKPARTKRNDAQAEHALLSRGKRADMNEGMLRCPPSGYSSQNCGEEEEINRVYRRVC